MRSVKEILGAIPHPQQRVLPLHRAARARYPSLSHVLDRIPGGYLRYQYEITLAFDGGGALAIAFGDSIDHFFATLVQVRFAEVGAVLTLVDRR